MRRTSWETAHDRFADEVAGSGADDETDDHAYKGGYDCPVRRSYSVHLLLVRRKQRED